VTDTPPPPGAIDPVALASDVRRALAQALDARGVDAASPEVRRAIVDALTERPLDRKLTAAQKRRYALELRTAGATYREIADLVGFAGPGPAYKSVMRGLEDLTREPAEAVRQIAVERLEGILAGGLYRKAKAGDVQAIDRVLKVMRETRRYIPGVEVPVSAELTGAGGGAIIVELNIPEPTPVTPVPQGELAGLVLDLESEEVEDASDVDEGDE
jgi:hypothetical protein